MNNKLKTGAAAMAAIVCITGCSLGKKAEPVKETDAAIAVSVKKAENNEIVKYNHFMGRVMPDSTVFVIPKVAGEVVKINVGVGDTVKKGQVLFEIDSTIDKLQLKQAQSSLDSAKAGLESAMGATYEAQLIQMEGQLKQAQSKKKWNSDTYVDYDETYEATADSMQARKKMAEKAMKDAKAAHDADPTNQGLIDAYTGAKIAYNEVCNAYDNFINGYQAQYNQLTQGLEQIEIGLEMAEKSYDLAKGKAHDEQLKTIKAQLGQAQAGYEMALQKLSYSSVISPIDGVVEQKNIELHAMAGQSSPAFVVTEKSALNVTFGVSAEIASHMSVGDLVTVSSSLKDYEAPIVEIAGMIDPQSGLFTVKAQITEEAPELLSGVAVKLTAQTAKNSNAIIIDAGSLYHQNNEAYVFINSDGKAVRKVVKTGIVTDTTAEILEGIHENDEVITSWNPSLTDGAAVAVKQEV